MLVITMGNINGDVVPCDGFARRLTRLAALLVDQGPALRARPCRSAAFTFR